MATVDQATWIDASADLAPEFIKSLRYGQVLGFVRDGVKSHFKVVRLNRKSGKCFLKPVTVMVLQDGRKAVAD